MPPAPNSRSIKRICFMSFLSALYSAADTA
jgi:hypothetical protein